MYNFYYYNCLGYYYASNIVLEESMVQVSFDLTTVILLYALHGR